MEKQSKYPVAEEIIRQLGGMGRLSAMMGAYNFAAIGDKGVSFRIKNRKANYIKIMLNSMDLYDLEVGRIRGFDYKIVADQRNIMAEDLKKIIERVTGMYLSLRTGGMIEVDNDGFEVRYYVDSSEQSVEVDAKTRDFLVDVTSLVKDDFRRLANTYIFWYDDLSDETISEIEDALKTKVT